jgi:nitrite reductase (cytochrome c-552)
VLCLKKSLFLSHSFLPSLTLYITLARSAKETALKGAGECYQCHEQIKSLKIGTKHSSLPCSKCHGKLSEHLKDPEKKPKTNLELSRCRGCHPSQYETYISVNLNSNAKVEKAMATSRSPTFDQWMMPHGFTKEHDEPWSHVFMLTAHLKEISNPSRLWEVLIDTGKELPQTAKAGNTVCLTWQGNLWFNQCFSGGNQDSRENNRRKKVIKD